MDSDVELLIVENNAKDICYKNTCIEMDLNELEDGEIKPTFSLPEGKDRHIFVSYCSEDSERVWPIVDALEKRYNLKCIYGDRDFQPGKGIPENINDAMHRSWKILLMLTPNFTQSGWCKYEREFAFVQSVETGINRIIPVLLEDCELPPTLVPLTYIKATEPFCDIPEKVIEAMNNPGDVSLPDDSAKYENGYFITIPARRESLCYCRPANYKFKVESCDFKEMRRSKIQIPIPVLEEGISILNKHHFLRYFDFIKSPKRCCCWFCLIFPVVFLWMYFASCVPLLRQSRFSDVHKRIEENYQTNPCDRGLTPAFVGVFVVIMVLLFMIMLCIFPCLGCSSIEFHRNAQKKMWELMSRKLMQNNTILVFWQKRFGPPQLSIIRYDIKKCQEYLWRKIQSRGDTRRENDTDAQEHAFNLIDNYLAAVGPIMVKNFDSLPNAPFKRHSVIKGKACLCQNIEQNL